MTLTSPLGGPILLPPGPPLESLLAIDTDGDGRDEIVRQSASGLTVVRIDPLSATAAAVLPAFGQDALAADLDGNAIATFWSAPPRVGKWSLTTPRAASSIGAA